MTASGIADMKVLIIDDEAFALSFLTKVLQAAGVGQVLSDSSGEQALERLKGLDRSAVDVVITDIEMPDMNGFEFSRRIRYGGVPHFKDVPIMILSGNVTEENQRHARTHKVNALLSKPPSVDVMRLQLEALLSRA